MVDFKNIQVSVASYDSCDRILESTPIDTTLNDASFARYSGPVLARESDIGLDNKTGCFIILDILEIPWHSYVSN